eukprot:7508671-Lingulodinium_polyedra.AAC.1
MALLAASDVLVGESEGGPGVPAEVEASTSLSVPLAGRPQSSRGDAWPVRVVAARRGRPGEAVDNGLEDARWPPA